MDISDSNEGDDVIRKGNEWEVVALTDSVYAAAPSPEQHILHYTQTNIIGGDNAETAHAMFLPLESECKEKCCRKGSDNSKTEYKHEENLSIKGLLSDENVGVPQFDVKGDSMSFYGSDRGDIVSSNSTDKEQGLFGTDKFSSYNDEAVAGMSYKADERIGIAKPLESLGCAVNAGVSKFDEGKYNEQTNLPREAWWRSYAASIYGRAKKANPFWSIAVAAVVVGLVITGHRVQRDRSQVFQLNSELGIGNEVLDYSSFESYLWSLCSI
ncbi:hypothetical protein OROHE_017293 [Orobanche hederae]